MSTAIQIRLRRPVELMKAVVSFFVDRGRLVLCGELTRVELSTIVRAGGSVSDRELSIPITSESLDTINVSVLPRVGLKRHVKDVFVMDERQTLFSAYDWFSDGLAVIWGSDQDALLDELLKQGLVESSCRLSIEEPVQSE